MYHFFGQIVEENEWLQAVILADNAHFLKSISSSPKPGLPRFYPCGMIETSMLFGSRRARKPSTNLEVRPANLTDLDAMQAFLDREGPKKQFFPDYKLHGVAGSSDFFRGLKIDDYWLVWDGSRLVGMAGLWDQKSFKQTRVVQYSPALNGLRHLYNLHSFLRGGPHLPAAGGQLRYLSLHTILVENNQPELFKILLDHLYAEFGTRYDALVCGFFEEDPLVKTLSGLRRETLRSQHFLFSYAGSQGHIDPRLELEQGRIPFADIARL